VAEGAASYAAGANPSRKRMLDASENGPRGSIVNVPRDAAEAVSRASFNTASSRRAPEHPSALGSSCGMPPTSASAG
jgi:hypothetical protein